MNYIFTILSDNALEKSFERYFKYVYPANLLSYQVVSMLKPPDSESDRKAVESKWIADTFTSISEWLNHHLAENNLTKGIAFIDLYDDGISTLRELNPVLKLQWAAVAALLVLAFPEIHWIFITPYKLGQKSALENDRFDSFHRLMMTDPKIGKRPNLRKILEIYDGNFSPLFDPLGFRNLIREQIRITPGHKQDEFKHIPLRKQLSMTIDEEKNFVDFIGYTAYRFGYRVMQVNSYFILKKLSKEILNVENKVELLYEDKYLNFYDRPYDISLYDIEQRHSKYFNFECPSKITVTAGHDNEKPDKTTRHLIYKPLSGVFNFWRETEQRTCFIPSAENPKKIAEYYKTTHPLYSDNQSNNSNSSGEKPHSSPGRLLLLAECLLDRANRFADRANKVSEAILGATLALEALEYLGYKTPTASLKALALKQKLEVIAESLFYGVGYGIEQKERFEEIEKEINLIGNWFNENERSNAILNAEIKIINDMALVFQEQGLFDEESECGNKIRSLYTDLNRSRQIKNEKRNGLIQIPSVSVSIEYILRKYINCLMKDIGNFLLAVVGWVSLFSILFAVLDVFIFNSTIYNAAGHGIYDACIAFFSLQPSHDIMESNKVIKEGPIMVLSIICIIISYFHLGIFISYIYSLIIRKQ